MGLYLMLSVLGSGLLCLVGLYFFVIRPSEELEQKETAVLATVVSTFYSCLGEKGIELCAVNFMTKAGSTPSQLNSLKDQLNVRSEKYGSRQGEGKIAQSSIMFTPIGGEDPGAYRVSFQMLVSFEKGAELTEIWTLIRDSTGSYQVHSLQWLGIK